MDDMMNRNKYRMMDNHREVDGVTVDGEVRSWTVQQGITWQVGGVASWAIQQAMLTGEVTSWQVGEVGSWSNKQAMSTEICADHGVGPSLDEDRCVLTRASTYGSPFWFGLGAFRQAYIPIYPSILRYCVIFMNISV